MKISKQFFVRVYSPLHCSHIEEHKLDSFQNMSVIEVVFVNRGILESTSEASCLWLHKSSLMTWNRLWNECQWRSWIANIIWFRLYTLLNHQAKTGKASDQSSRAASDNMYYWVQLQDYKISFSASHGKGKEHLLRFPSSSSLLCWQ